MIIEMKTFAVVLLVFIFCHGMAQNISIEGTSHAKEGDLVRVLLYADQFSMLEKTIAQTRCNEQGNFVLTAPLTLTTFGFLALNLDKGELYLRPGASYQVSIPAQQPEIQGSIFDQVPLQFNMEVTNDDNLQTDIGLFNQLYNQFIYENAQVIYKSRNKQVLDDFKSEMTLRFKDRKSEYLRDYIHYAFVSLEWLSKRLSNNEILEMELVSNPVLYNNIQYTDFFKTYFDNYLDAFSNRHYNELTRALNQPGDYLTLKQMLQRDSLLKTNDRVVELAMMLLMSKSYSLPEIKKTEVINKLKLLSGVSKFPENKEIATHFIEKLTDLTYGYPAPSFAVKNEYGIVVELNHYAGKFVLLNFISDRCQICFNELEKIQKISLSFQGKVDLLTLVVSDEWDNAMKYKHDKQFQWEFLKVTRQMLLPEQYHVRTFPTYILINPDGTIANATMPMPDENMEPYITRYVKRFQSKP